MTTTNATKTSDATQRRFGHGKFGLTEDPRGHHVTMSWFDRELLGEVTDVYRCEVRGITFLKVRHFNGEPWPIDPGFLNVWVLRQV